MGHTVAVMITKGGVGKSTLAMGLAETLSAYHGQRVLIVDSDPQSSVSSMLMPPERLRALQQEGKTFAEFLNARMLEGRRPDWRAHVLEQVSDVDDAGSVSLLPGNVHLALFEREVSARLSFAQVSDTVAELAQAFAGEYDLVLIDCPPALTFLTEAWLRRAGHHLSPTRPDYLGLHGLDVMRRFETMSPELGFSRRLGVVVNMMDDTSPVDRKFHDVLRAAAAYRCFDRAVPAHATVRHASVYHPAGRSFMAKYPGIGHALRQVGQEFLARLTRAQQADAPGQAPPARPPSPGQAGPAGPAEPPRSPSAQGTQPAAPGPAPALQTPAGEQAAPPAPGNGSGGANAGNAGGGHSGPPEPAQPSGPRAHHPAVNEPV